MGRRGLSKEEFAKRKAFWTDLITKQRASGMSINAFCKENGVHPSKFYEWRSIIFGYVSSKSGTNCPVITPNTLDGWAKLIREQKESGLTVGQFCANHRLDATVFERQISRLTKETAKNAYALGVIDVPAGESKAELKHHYKKAEERRAAEAKKEIASEPKSLLERGKEIVVEARVNAGKFNFTAKWGGFKIDGENVSVDEFKRVLDMMQGEI